MPAPWDAQGDVHLASARKVKGVQGHLRGGLPNALGSQQAHSFAWVAQRALPFELQQGPQPGGRQQRLGAGTQLSVPVVSFWAHSS